MIKMLCCLMAGFFTVKPVSAEGISADDRAAIEKIEDEFQKECSALQPSRMHPNSEAHPNALGHLDLSDESIYQLPITPDGKMATILIPEFKCADVGYAWCGTGGCGFFIFVNGIPYRNWVSHPPHSITVQTYTEPRTILIYPKHGGDCQAANGEFRSGTESCYSLFFWDDASRTFISPDGSVVEWYPNMP